MLGIVAGLLLSAGLAPPKQALCDDLWKASRPSVEDLRAGREVPVTVAKGLPPYHFHIEADPDCGEIRRIKVRTAEGLLLQTLAVDGLEAPFVGSTFFAAEDLNFDGFADVKCLAWWGATGNLGYEVWLFNPKSKRFEPSPDLTKLGNPVPDAKTQEIRTGVVRGMAGNLYARVVYKWRDGRLALLSSEHQDWDAKARCFVRVSKTFDGPRPKTTRKVVCDPNWK